MRAPVMISDVIDYGDQVCSDSWISVDDGGLFHKLYYVRGGEAFYSDDECELTLRPGNLYLLPMYRRFQVRHQPQNPFTVTWMHLESSQVLCYHPVLIDLEEASVMEELLLLLRRTILERQGKLLLPLAETVIRLMSERCNLMPVLPEQLEDILRLLQENQDRILSNEELAMQAGYSKSHLVRLFREYLGVSPRQYQLQARFNQAKKLLRQGVPSNEIAEMLGFSSAASFGRDFKGAFNISPGQYQKTDGVP